MHGLIAYSVRRELVYAHLLTSSSKNVSAAGRFSAGRVGLRPRGRQRDRVDPSTAQRAAPEQPTRRQERATERSVLPVGVQGVLTAGRVEPTVAPQKRAQREAVGVDQ